MFENKHVDVIMLKWLKTHSDHLLIHLQKCFQLSFNYDFSQNNNKKSVIFLDIVFADQQELKLSKLIPFMSLTVYR